MAAKALVAVDLVVVAAQESAVAVETVLVARAPASMAAVAVEDAA